MHDMHGHMQSQITKHYLNFISLESFALLEKGVRYILPLIFLNILESLEDCLCVLVLDLTVVPCNKISLYVYLHYMSTYNGLECTKRTIYYLS